MPTTQELQTQIAEREENSRQHLDWPKPGQVNEMRKRLEKKGLMYGRVAGGLPAYQPPVFPLAEESERSPKVAVSPSPLPKAPVFRLQPTQTRQHKQVELTQRLQQEEDLQLARRLQRQEFDQQLAKQQQLKEDATSARYLQGLDSTLAALGTAKSVKPLHEQALDAQGLLLLIAVQTHISVQIRQQLMVTQTPNALSLSMSLSMSVSVTQSMYACVIPKQMMHQVIARSGSQHPLFGFFSQDREDRKNKVAPEQPSMSATFSPRSR